MPTASTPALFALALSCHYNGRQGAIVRRGAVLFPAQEYFTIMQPGTPAHGATFCVPADGLTEQAVEAKRDECASRF